MAMARSKLEEHKLRDVELSEVAPGEALELGTVRAGDDPHDALDSRLVRGGARDRARDGADHRRLQVRPDARRRPAGRRLAPGGAGTRGRPAAVRRLHERRPRGLLALGVGRRPAPAGGLRALRGADRGDELRLQHPPRAAGRRRRARARPQGRAGGALDAQERRHRPLAGPHRGARGDARRAARDRRLPRRADRDHLDGLPGRAALGAAPHGLPRPSPGAAAPRRHGRLLGDPGAGQRARGQRDDRPALPHRLPRRDAARRARARLRARLRGGGQADAEPRPAALRDALPRRLQAPAHARPARGGRRDRADGHLPGRQRPAARHRRARRALRQARAARA